MEADDLFIRITLDGRSSIRKQAASAIPQDLQIPGFYEQAVNIVVQTAEVGLDSVRIRYPNNTRRYAVSLVYKR